MESDDSSNSNENIKKTKDENGGAKVDEERMLHDLELIKILRPKTNQLENLRAQILNEIDLYKKEEQLEEGCKRELKALELERKHYVDALTTIDQDVDQLHKSMASSIKERKDVKTRTLELYDSYQPLKDEVDANRVAIGLDCLPEFTELKDILKP